MSPKPSKQYGTRMQMEHKPAVVIDTNLLVGAFISRGIGFQVVEAWRQRHFSLLISQPLINEANDVLHRKKIYQRYHLSENLIQQFLADLRIASTFITSMSVYELPVHSRDIKDDIVLACAISGQADYVVSLDEDLLVLQGEPRLAGLQIITPMQFLAIIKPEQKKAA
jgi:putative PIN family toxin of toxin-antitoxin system